MATDSSPSLLLSDPLLAPFLADNFSSQAYLNGVVPSLTQIPATTVTKPQSLQTNSLPAAAPRTNVSSLYTQAQSHLSNVEILLQRLIGQLTDLTDEIVRVVGGGRVGYELEVLKADALALGEEMVNSPIFREFGVKPLKSRAAIRNKRSLEDLSINEDSHSPEVAGANEEEEDLEPQELSKPDVMKRLEMLVLVRAKMEEVIKVFGDAMEWSLPAGPVTAASALGGYSTPGRTASPALGSGQLSANSKANKAANGTERITEDLTFLLLEGQANPESLERAKARVEELERLLEVWKGTSEISARKKLVEVWRGKVDRASAPAASKASATPPTSSTSQYTRAVQVGRANAGVGGSEPAADSSLGWIGQLGRMRAGGL